MSKSDHLKTSLLVKKVELGKIEKKLKGNGISSKKRERLNLRRLDLLVKEIPSIQQQLNQLVN